MDRQGRTGEEFRGQDRDQGEKHQRRLSSLRPATNWRSRARSSSTEAAKPHKTIDWTNFKANGDDVPDNFGVYELKDDEFKVCNGGPGNDRPKKFEDAGDGMPSVVVFKRVKEEKKEEKKDK